MAGRPSAVASVLELPELLDIILSYVFENFESYREAYRQNRPKIRESVALLCVSKLWFSIGVRYIWRNLNGRERPVRSNLEKLVDDPERLQIYARCIENLSISNDDRTFYSELGNDDEHTVRPPPCVEEPEELLRLEHVLLEASFPRLCQIEFNSETFHGHDLVPFSSPLTRVYLRDNLKRLSICKLAPPAEFWSMLKNRCPNIEELVIYVDSFGARVDQNEVKAFLEFLESSNKLTKVSLCYDPFVTLKTLHCLARMRSILHCNLLGGEDWEQIPEEWIRPVLTVTPDSFENLKELYLTSTVVAFALLKPNLRNLEKLHVVLRGDGAELDFRAPHNMPYLRSLAMSIPSDSIIDGEDLLGLATYCPQLTSIAIGTAHYDFEYNRNYDGHDDLGCMKIRGISDSVITTLVQLLPNLELLDLLGDCSSLTEQALIQFGRHCKALQRLTLPHTLDFTKLANIQETGLFPTL